MSIAKTLPELTSWIESKIRAVGRDNDIYDWSSCVELYAAMIDERTVMVNKVLRCDERPTWKILQSLIGHMGITAIYETSTMIGCSECGRSEKQYYYNIKTISRD